MPELQQLLSGGKLAANNNTNKQYGYIAKHLNVRLLLGAFTLFDPGLICCTCFAPTADVV